MYVGHPTFGALAPLTGKWHLETAVWVLDESMYKNILNSAARGIFSIHSGGDGKEGSKAVALNLELILSYHSSRLMIF